MATSLTLQNDASLAQGYVKVNGTTSATFTTSGITANLTGNVTGNATTATALSTASGSAPSYACRAWVNFDGTRDTTGAVSTANTNRFIRSSGNVTSVLRNAAGDYTVNFATPMANANYSVSSMSNGDNGDGSSIYWPTLASNSSRTTSSVRILIKAYTNTLADASVNCVQVFGN
jgi:hypothetical protein